MKKVFLSIMTVAVFSSCKQWKNLTVKDNSAYTPPPKAKSRDVRFLEDISVTPGQVVTSKHVTTGSETRKASRSMIYPQTVEDLSTSPERGTYLQAKYAGILNTLPETLTNLNLLNLIEEWWGTKYCIGGSSRECLDCSAFTQMITSNVYRATLPRTAQDQYNSCEKVLPEELQEGNLVFFHTSGREISHVGVYLANNKFVHVSTSQGVMINDLNDRYWKDKFRGAGRYN
ncbi:NlpC/P60 family protein [Segetibacter sp. 3557_3]|uniref:C40 family peptidase n=1 Tax=Segetibacter sp. 3557_3 TaxID=2547429 RepID=UPI001058CC15|nr:C40 family peptidase [Segetibacter sp. 3557_3]TDH26865.1 NlpC/P60 family protein [Segetibacter sp. 3557_3]